ncbi:MAG: glycosyltransferase family 4 protein, partial [Candidatus Gracilibacteria bacterium]|nr:glycosyltransferase family 4 protein [Candidatus Gracilibacteria bacterium]
LIIDTFNKNGKKLIIATNTDNKLYKKLKNISKENISWKFAASREEIQQYYAEAKGFLFPPEEDFGLVPLEAMASGTPVIAYGKGGALETVLENSTGVFFPEQSSESLNKTLEKFETMSFDPYVIQKHAQKFDKTVFEEKILHFITQKIRTK